MIKNPSSICFIAGDQVKSSDLFHKFTDYYGQKTPEEAEIIVVLGGDGLMLRNLHRFMNSDKYIYGMNYGSIGFLMNANHFENLPERIAKATIETVHPLKMQATSKDGELSTFLAINEVSLFRQSFQATKVEISVDGKVRMPELICDGILVATAIGSTAYNLSAHGPILPLKAPLIALTPVSPYRPRRWHGALLSDKVVLEFRLLEAEKRPTNAGADNDGVHNVVHVKVWQSHSNHVNLLFDECHSWDERILAEQFSIY